MQALDCHQHRLYIVPYPASSKFDVATVKVDVSGFDLITIKRDVSGLIIVKLDKFDSTAVAILVDVINFDSNCSWNNCYRLGYSGDNRFRLDGNNVVVVVIDDLVAIDNFRRTAIAIKMTDLDATVGGFVAIIVEIIDTGTIVGWFHYRCNCD